MGLQVRAAHLPTGDGLPRRSRNFWRGAFEVRGLGVYKVQREYIAT